MEPLGRWATSRWNPRSRLIAIKAPLGPLAVNILFSRLVLDAVLPRTPNTAAESPPSSYLAFLSFPRICFIPLAPISEGPNSKRGEFEYDLPRSATVSETMEHRWTTRDASKWSNNRRTCVPAQGSPRGGDGRRPPRGLGPPLLLRPRDPTT